MKVIHYKPRMRTFKCSMTESVREASEPILDVEILLLNVPASEKETHYFGLKASFSIGLERMDLFGSMDQIVKVEGKKIESKEDFTKEEMTKLLEILMRKIDEFSQEIKVQIMKRLE